VRSTGLCVWVICLAVPLLCLSGCDKIGELLGLKGDNKLIEKEEIPAIGQYDKVALKRKFGAPNEVTEKLGWIKKEHGVQYNNKWVYHYRKNRDSMKLTTRALYFIDDEFQGAIIIDEEGRARRETIGSL
jgi:hypothetical protein